MHKNLSTYQILFHHVMLPNALGAVHTDGRWTQRFFRQSWLTEVVVVRGPVVIPARCHAGTLQSAFGTVFPHLLLTPNVCAIQRRAQPIDEEQNYTAFTPSHQILFDAICSRIIISTLSWLRSFVLLHSFFFRISLLPYALFFDSLSHFSCFFPFIKTTDKVCSGLSTFAS